MDHVLKSFYEKFCYPGYPLWLPLRLQDGFFGTSVFANWLTGVSHNSSPILGKTRLVKVLNLGCGDTAPLITSALEPGHHKLFFVDLSHASLRRAKQRLAMHLPWRLKNSKFLCEDLHNLQWKNEFSHIDCYGVLHHCSDPLESFVKLASLLKPGGTLRLMVYNPKRRVWLRVLQNYLKGQGLCAEQDCARAMKIVKEIRRSSTEPIGRVLGQFDCSFFSNCAKFADTFLHVRENSLTLADIQSVKDRTNLNIVGAYSRHEKSFYSPSSGICPDSPVELYFAREGFESIKQNEATAGRAWMFDLSRRLPSFYNSQQRYSLPGAPSWFQLLNACRKGERLGPSLRPLDKGQAGVGSSESEGTPSWKELNQCADQYLQELSSDWNSPDPVTC